MAKFEGDKTFIANMCISKPKIVANIISEWIENDEEQGVSKAVKSLISVDEKLLTYLKPHISSNIFEMINFGINNFDALTLEERIRKQKISEAVLQLIKRLQMLKGRKTAYSTL